MSAPKFKVYPSPDGRWRWTLVASNGEILCPSQGYARRSGALAGIAALQRNARRGVVVFVDEAPSKA